MSNPSHILLSLCAFNLLYPTFYPPLKIMQLGPDVVAYIFNPISLEAEAGKSLELEPTEFQARWGHIVRPCLRKKVKILQLFHMVPGIIAILTLAL